MDSSDGLSKQYTDIDSLDLITLKLLNCMRYCVCDDNLHKMKKMKIHYILIA